MGGNVHIYEKYKVIYPDFQVINLNFFHLPLKYLWSTYSLADTVLGTRDTAMNKTEEKTPAYMVFTVLWW